MYVTVALDVPLQTVFDYHLPEKWLDKANDLVGHLVSVPFGRQTLTGVIVGAKEQTTLDSTQCKDVFEIFFDLPALNADWLALTQFAAHYYLRAWGEVILPSLPAALRDSQAWSRTAKIWQSENYYLIGQTELEKNDRATELASTLNARSKGALSALQALSYENGLGAEQLKALGRTAQLSMQKWLEEGYIESKKTKANILKVSNSSALKKAPILNPEQLEVVKQVEQSLAPQSRFTTYLLHGVTGSGKTETYLNLVEIALTQSNDAQVLMLVPEINLTPQLEVLIRDRFPNTPIAILHSAMTENERSRNWLAAHLGEARIVLGTRLAVMASLPKLQLIIVDEEHDASYKQQEGLRYSARDLAIWRAKHLHIPILLGSATPSLESWHAAQSGRYTLLQMKTRAVSNDGVKAQLPTVQIINITPTSNKKNNSVSGLSQALMEAINVRLNRGEQSLIYLNRRGYAPVLQCGSCGWLSGCPRCSAYMVWHRHTENAHPRNTNGVLRCHHCSYETAVPKHCPDCGNSDLSALGRGTQKIEEALTALYPNARIARIDADSTRRKGSAQTLFDTVHAGEVDILVGTQMIAKGHDFKKVSLVGIVNPDSALYSHDFRASERLFAQLMQVTGRAGRAGLAGEVMVQTQYPQAAVYQALQAHDYENYANLLLSERKSALLPPFSFQALLMVEAANLNKALAFLQSAREAAEKIKLCSEGQVICHDPVPRSIVKIARKERAQLLVESYHRQALQNMLDEWLPMLAAIRPRQSWQIERDPASI